MRAASVQDVVGDHWWFYSRQWPTFLEVVRGDVWNTVWNTATNVYSVQVLSLEKWLVDLSLSAEVGGSNLARWVLVTHLSEKVPTLGGLFPHYFLM